MSVIAIFDSGVGGLTIYQAIKQQLPDSQYIFISDNQAFPYGTKPEQELSDRVLAVTKRIIEQFDPDILVVACNTASTVVLPLLRETFDLPIVGVVPAIKPAAELSQTKKIGLLATPATIERDYTNQLIAEFASDCEVTRVGSSRLVQIAEDKLSAKPVSSAEITQQLQAFIEADDIDIIVLACTHFPLLNNEINRVLNVNDDAVKLIDSGQGIANRVVRLLESFSTKQVEPQRSIAVFTDLKALPDELASKLKQLGFKGTVSLN